MTPSSLFSARESEAEPYMHCLAATDSETKTFVALPSAEDLDIEEKLSRIEVVAASIVKLPKSGKNKAKKDPSSGPPSPPNDVASARVTIGPCPARLKPYIPPPNYGTVELDKVFRSSFPQDRNIDFVKTLQIRSILTLVGTEPTDGFAQWLNDDRITQLRIDIAPNKEGVVNTSLDSLCQALLFVMDSRNYPLYIHCNQGKHRTGCVVACLRKIQGMPIEDVIAEYRVYSEPKARDGDMELIRSFDPEVVFKYAQTHGYFNGAFGGLKRADSVSINDINTLAAALAAGAMNHAGDVDMELSITSSTSTSSSMDDALEMSFSNPAADAGLVNGARERDGGDVADRLMESNQRYSKIANSPYPEQDDMSSPDADVTMNEEPVVNGGNASDTATFIDPTMDIDA